MITSIAAVKKEFYGAFYKAPIVILPKGVSTIVTVSHANSSVANYSEAGLQQSYPCISLYDFTPELSEKWSNTGQLYYTNERDTNADGVIDKVGKYYEPILLNFRFDVSSACKDHEQHVCLEDYFLKNFLYKDNFLLNKKIIDGEEVGESVFLYCRPTTVPRTDGIFETNYEFNFDAWLQVQDPEDVDTLQNLNISITPINLP